MSHLLFALRCRHRSQYWTTEETVIWSWCLCHLIEDLAPAGKNPGCLNHPVAHSCPRDRMTYCFQQQRCLWAIQEWRRDWRMSWGFWDRNLKEWRRTALHLLADSTASVPGNINYQFVRKLEEVNYLQEKNVLVIHYQRSRTKTVRTLSRWKSCQPRMIEGKW